MLQLRADLLAAAKTTRRGFAKTQGVHRTPRLVLDIAMSENIDK